MDNSKTRLQNGNARIFTDHAVINAVWEKAVSELGFVFFRRDHLGNVIARHHFNSETEYGWIIEHIVHPSAGGDDSVANLRPVHWKHADTQPAGDPQEQQM